MKLQGVNNLNKAGIYSQNTNQLSKSLAFGATLKVVDEDGLLNDEKALDTTFKNVSDYFLNNKGDSIENIENDLAHRLDAEGAYEIHFKKDPGNYGNHHIEFLYENTEKIKENEPQKWVIDDFRKGTLTSKFREFMSHVETKLYFIQKDKNTKAALEELFNKLKSIKK